MDDSDDLSNPDSVADLMSETNVKRLKATEGALLIDDGSPKWISNVLSAIEGSPEACLQGFLAVVYTLMYESGFYFVDGPRNNSVTYDVSVMRQLDDPSALLKKIKKCDSKYNAVFSHKLLEPKTVNIVSFAVTDSVKDVVVINFLFPDKSIVFTELFERVNYIISVGPKNRLELCSFNMQDLSFKIKSVSYSLQNLSTADTYHPHHILTLPLHILQLLCKLMGGKSFRCFLQTCKYINDNFGSDQSLWKYHSLIEYRCLNKLKHETWRDHYKYQFCKKESKYTLRKAIHSPFIFI